VSDQGIGPLNLVYAIDTTMVDRALPELQNRIRRAALSLGDVEIRDSFGVWVVNSIRSMQEAERAAERHASNMKKIMEYRAEMNWADPEVRYAQFNERAELAEERHRTRLWREAQAYEEEKIVEANLRRISTQLKIDSEREIAARRRARDFRIDEEDFAGTNIRQLMIKLDPAMDRFRERLSTLPVDKLREIERHFERMVAEGRRLESQLRTVRYVLRGMPSGPGGSGGAIPPGGGPRILWGDWSDDDGDGGGRGSGGTGAGSNVRRFRYMTQNLAFGFEDALVSYQVGGARGAARAVGNNLSAIAAAGISNPVTSAAAIAGIAVITASVGPIVDRLLGSTEKAEEAAKRRIQYEKEVLNLLEAQVELQNRLARGSSGTIEAGMYSDEDKLGKSIAAMKQNQAWRSEAEQKIADKKKLRMVLEYMDLERTSEDPHGSEVFRKKMGFSEEEFKKYRSEAWSYANKSIFGFGGAIQIIDEEIKALQEKIKEYDEHDALLATQNSALEQAIKESKDAFYKVRELEDIEDRMRQARTSKFRRDLSLEQTLTDNLIAPEEVGRRLQNIYDQQIAAIRNDTRFRPQDRKRLLDSLPRERDQEVREAVESQQENYARRAKEDADKAEALQQRFLGTLDPQQRIRLEAQKLRENILKLHIDQARKDELLDLNEKVMQKALEDAADRKKPSSPHFHGDSLDTFETGSRADFELRRKYMSPNITDKAEQQRERLIAKMQEVKEEIARGRVNRRPANIGNN
jgi:hypothetical protein